MFICEIIHEIACLNAAKRFFLLACKEAPGFYGSFCNITCPSGSYGVDCAGDCTPTCLYYQCHHVYGCLKNITDQVTTISSGNKCLLISISEMKH